MVEAELMIGVRQGLCTLYEVRYQRDNGDVYACMHADSYRG